jgi:carboxyl-terminal processing protease
MRLKWTLMVLVVAGAFFGGGWLLRRARPSQPPSIPSIGAVPTRPAGSSLFQGVFQTVQSHAVDSLDLQAIYQRATTGLLSELGDPYAAIVTGVDSGPVARLGEEPVQGIYLDQAEGFVEVVAVIPGSPADSAGVRPGDAVLAIDRTPINLQRAEEVGRLMDGTAGSTVRVRLGREAHEGPLWVTLTRGSTPAHPSVAVDVLDPGVVRVKLARIDSAAAAAASRIIDSLAATARAVVLDLRGVADGTFGGAVALAEELLDDGSTIVTTRSRTGQDTMVHRDRVTDRHPALALAVLVDRSTAGPAELLAGALQDHDRGIIIGEATYGRGSSQSVFPLGTGSSLRLTTSLWVTPSGRVIQRMPVAEPSDGSPPDTATIRPKFTTRGGRTVLGGGGIVPDREVPVEVEPSGATDPVLALARSLIQGAKDRKALLAAVTAP